MIKQPQLNQMEEEYRQVATSLARMSSLRSNSPEIAEAEYTMLLQERVRLKSKLWSLGNRNIVLQIDRECIEELRKRQKAML